MVLAVVMVVVVSVTLVTMLRQYVQLALRWQKIASKNGGGD